MTLLNTFCCGRRIATRLFQFIICGVAIACITCEPLLADEQRQASSHSLPSEPLEFSKWSGDIVVPDPVAISVDDQGRVFVTQTQRRKSQDLDIRQHLEWVSDDLSFQSVSDKRAFYHRVLAGNNSNVASRHVQDMNKDGQHDYRDLMVLSEKIHLLRDRDGDGTADSTTVFADGFQTEVTGIAAGVLATSDGVYATIAPDVWRLQDTDGDGKADHREAIASGFGLHIAYAGHDMHGLTQGPDGKIYWSIGDKGISVRDSAGHQHHYPNQGGVMRCNPDGSDFEVFAHGLRNVQELAFDEFGNLFGVDNDADKPGERERFVYIVKGMDAGWRCNYQYRGGSYDPWIAEKLWQPFHHGQPAYIVPPISHSIDGPAGFAFNPGCALSPEYRDYFFLTGAPNGPQIAFQIVPDGAAFRVINEHTIGKSLPLVGINFGPDGALYAVDWGGGYPLNQKGAVWKIDVPGHAEDRARREVQQMLSHGFSDFSNIQLTQLFNHADQRIRLHAQFELVGRQAVVELTAASKAAERYVACHAVWGLGQLARSGNPDAVSALEALLSQTDAVVLTQVIRTIGDLPEFQGDVLVRFLSHQQPQVQFAAASALGDHPSGAAVTPLVELLERIPEEDTYLRFATIRGLTSSATPEQLAELRSHSSTNVRLAAVVALRRQGSAQVAAYLEDDSEWVATEAARAIHDDFSIAAALPDLANALEATTQTDDAFVRRCINAAFRIGTPQQSALLARYAQRQDAPMSLRLVALDSLRHWNSPEPLDRVTGRWREFDRSHRGVEGDILAAAFSQLLTDDQPDIRAAAMTAADSLAVPLDNASLLTLALADNSPSSVRLAAFTKMKAQNAKSVDPVVNAFLSAKDSALRISALDHVAIEDADRAVSIARERLAETSDVRERQHIVRLLGTLNTTAADGILLELLAQLEAGQWSELRLELQESAELRSSRHPEIATAVRQIQEELQEKSDDPVTQFRECLEGGHAESGKAIFQTHLAAQCIRCHRIGKQGSNVGPDLSDVAIRRDSKYLLRAIVAPSADIDQKYRTRIVVLSSGKTVQGIQVRRDDDTLVLADNQGKEISLSVDDIDDEVEQNVSIMPKMTKELTRSQIRDLVAFLRTLRKKR